MSKQIENVSKNRKLHTILAKFIACTKVKLYNLPIRSHRDVGWQSELLKKEIVK